MKLRPAVFASILLSFPACSTVYYKAMEEIGFEKRDLLKRAVKASRNEQKEAGEEFQDALTQLKAMSKFDGGALESGYNRFKAEYDDCDAQARTVRSRIKEMDKVASDLFREWETEIGQFSNASMALDSLMKLSQTRSRYAQVSSALHASEPGMEPVLSQFRDQVLYLKHNLNAAAVGSLRGTADTLQGDLQRLLKQMNASIAEADKFVQTL
jgi:cell fate (sporulation/competence/biofilm development) regulator YmcA (YheA/YmcA/DUF963 family)